MARRAPYERYKREDVRVAGVTFENTPEDGGESRQQILSRLTGAPSVIKLEHCTFHREETGEDEPAIKVRSLANGKVIGYIPKNRIDEFSGEAQMIAQVSLYKGTYSCTLTRQERPSPKQYGAVMSMKRKGLIQRLPFYDKTSYQWALSQCPAAH